MTTKDLALFVNNLNIVLETPCLKLDIDTKQFNPDKITLMYSLDYNNIPLLLYKKEFDIDEWEENELSIREYFNSNFYIELLRMIVYSDVIQDIKKLKK